MEQRPATIMVGLLLALAGAAIAAVWFAFPTCGCSEPRWEGPAPMTAVIVDQLQLTSPDQAFVDSATQTLRAAGYTVDYVPGDQVTVDYYRELPSKGYGLVIIRAHSGFVLRNPNDTEPRDPFVFSSEPYSDDHAADREAKRLSAAYYLNANLGTLTSPDDLVTRFQNEPRYFGIKPSFIEQSTQGSFPGSTVVLMGCNGLMTDGLAQAFIDKGARAVVGWNDLVSAPHTDDTTQRLLERLVVDDLPLNEAVAEAAAELGPDPTYGGQLAYYE